MAVFGWQISVTELSFLEGISLRNCLSRLARHLDGFMVGITMVRAGRAIAAPSDRSVREYTPDTDRNVSQLFFALRTSNEI